MSGTSHPDATAALDAELAALHMEGHWKSNQDGLPAEPGGAAQPHLWRWDEVYPKLLKAGELLNNEAGASRRTLRLCTPGLANKATTRTIHTSIQMVKPGEVAKMHRHSIGAFRFILGGSGGITAVDGRRFVMQRHDLVLTPQWSWHEHSNDTAEPMIWIDGHDMPLMRSLDTIFFQSGKDDNAGPLVEPDDFSDVPQAEAYIYDGEETLAVLRGLGADAWNPFEGVVLEYRNPVTGGPTLPTILCRLHRLDAGEATQRRRLTASTIYHVIEGSGRSVVGDKTLDWKAGDIFVVPNWAWHSHRADPREPVTLFSVSDEPILAALGHLRSESVAVEDNRTISNGVRRHG